MIEVFGSYPDPYLWQMAQKHIDPTDPDLHAGPDPQHYLQDSYLAMPHLHFFTIWFSFL